MMLVPLEDGSPIVLNKAVIFFGRSQDCDITLSQSRKVSRKHCCVAQIDDRFVIRDLGSTNGVRVNEQRAEPELPIDVGDEVWIGDVGFRLQQSPEKNGRYPVKAEVQEANDEAVRRPEPHRDTPIPIPEEGRDFIVEESIQQKIVEDDDDEVASDDERF